MFMTLTFLTSYLDNAQFRGKKNQGGLKKLSVAEINFVQVGVSYSGSDFRVIQVEAKIRHRKREERETMQAAQITLKQYGHGGRTAAVEPQGLTAQLSNLLTRVFGCWHSEMSRPFTRDGESYRTCLECGARRNFDPMKWEMVGAYYYDSPKGHLTSLARTASSVISQRTRLPSCARGEV